MITALSPGKYKLHEMTPFFPAGSGFTRYPIQREAGKGCYSPGPPDFSDEDAYLSAVTTSFRWSLAGSQIIERKMEAVIMATVTAKNRRMTFFICLIVLRPITDCLRKQTLEEAIGRRNRKPV